MTPATEARSFEDDVDQTHDVDPDEVDWRSIFQNYASDDGVLDTTIRTRAVTESVEGIDNSRQAESLLAEAADSGEIESQSGDYYLEIDDEEFEVGEEESEVDQIEWDELFEEVAGGITEPLPDWGQRGFLIKHHLDLEAEDQAHDLVSDAREKGIIVQTTRDDEKGFYLTEGLEVERTNEEGSEETEDNEDDRLHPAVAAAREDAESTGEYISSLEELVSDVLDRVEAVEERQQNQDERFNDYVKEKHEEQRVGLTELQIRRLRNGDVLSKDGVDMDALEDEFGDDLVESAAGNAVRLTEPKEEDSARSTELPDFDDYCELEAERLKQHLQLKNPSDVRKEGITKYRCLTVWSNAETLAKTDDTYEGKMVITKDKLERWILKHARNGADETSMDTICNRVMDKMASWTDGVLEKDVSNGKSILTFDQEELEEARCARFQARELSGEDGGDLITPLL